MKRLFVFLTAAAALAAGAATVSGVSWTQDERSRTVTVNYTLAGAPAVVTFDFLTNGVSIGGVNLTGGNEPKPQPQGDVFKLVEANGAHSFTWQPDRTWSDHVAEGQIVVKGWSSDDPPDYMSVCVEANSGDPVTFYPAVEWLPGGILSNPVYRTGAVLMRRIHAKNVTWNMGTFAAVGNSALDNIPYPPRERMHAVTLDADYYLGVFEVTRSVSKCIGGHNAGVGLFSYATSMRPTDNDFSYHTIREWTNGAPDGASAKAIPQYQYPNPPSPDTTLGKLRARFGLAFDMPSEAQWEFAARAGHGDGYWPDGSAYAFTHPTNLTVSKVAADYYCEDPNLDSQSRYRYTCANPENPQGAYLKDWPTNGTAIVGSYAPNSWGLYDMLGNSREWCLDWYQDDITSLNGAVNANGLYCADGKTAGQKRVIRGGYYGSYAFQCRPSFRMGDVNDTIHGQGSTAATPYQRGGAVSLRLCCPADVSGLVNKEVK